MELQPPVEQYLSGEKPTHSSFANIHKFAKAWNQDEIVGLLKKGHYVSDEGKTTKLSLKKGLVDVCEGKILWNLLETKKALVAIAKIEIEAEETRKAARQRELENLNKESWVDLGVVGTYFGVSNIVVGKWLDQLGLRAKPELAKNSSGDFDMLDIARQKQQEQANGFIGKEPTEKAFNMGLARKLTVMNRKQKEIEIVQWNLQLCKAVLVRAGHELDTERKMMLKGKGKNSDVKVLTMDDRAKELYQKWRREYAQPSTRKESFRIFEKQPKPILMKIEQYMNKPGYLTNKEYVKDMR